MASMSLLVEGPLEQKPNPTWAHYKCSAHFVTIYVTIHRVYVAGPALRNWYINSKHTVPVHGAVGSTATYCNRLQVNVHRTTSRPQFHTQEPPSQPQCAYTKKGIRIDRGFLLGYRGHSIGWEADTPGQQLTRPQTEAKARHRENG